MGQSGHSCIPFLEVLDLIKGSDRIRVPTVSGHAETHGDYQPVGPVIDPFRPVLAGVADGQKHTHGPL